MSVLETPDVVGDFFRPSGELTLQLPALPRLSLEEIQKRFPFVKEIESGDISPTEAVTLELGTLLFTGEDSIPGKEYERRLSSGPYMGLQQAIYLSDHQDDPELATFKALAGKFYIDFPGIKAVDSGGARGVPYLGSVGGRWGVGFHGLESSFDRRGRVGRPASSPAGGG